MTLVSGQLEGENGGVGVAGWWHFHNLLRTNWVFGLKKPNANLVGESVIRSSIKFI